MEGFLRASLSGDMEALLELLSDDVALYSDGGGKTRAALRPAYGTDNVARFLTGILRNIPPGFAVKQTRVNGRPRRLLRGRQSTERRDPRVGRGEHQGHQARRQRREAR
jgi:hypothetical protein